MQARISLQKLFFIVCLLKVLSASIGFATDQIMLFGLVIPLLLMVAYIAIGYFLRDNEVSHEKFADSCYYLGFIFTIASIVFSLLKIGPDQNMNDIAMLFGAAMASTVLGVFVRVWLVSFRPNAEDAIQMVEDQVLDASRRLTEEYSLAADSLTSFRAEVTNATNAAVARVANQFASLAEVQNQQSKAFFAQMVMQNRQLLQLLLRDLRGTAQEINGVVEQYAASAKTTTTDLQVGVEQVVQRLSQRLDSLVFPDDLFSRRLEAPSANLGQSLEQIGSNAAAMAEGVERAASSVEQSVQRINSKAESIGHAVDVLREVSSDQQQLMGQMTQQQAAMVEAMDRHLVALSSELRAHGESTVEVNAMLTKAAAVLAASQQPNASAMEQGRQLLDANNRIASQLGKLIDLTETRLPANSPVVDRFTEVSSVPSPTAQKDESAFVVQSDEPSRAVI